MENISLVFLKPEEIGIIKGITNCGSAKRRLYELGLNKGTKVKMVKNDMGPLILNISGHKLALGRGLASKVIVEK